MAENIEVRDADGHREVLDPVRRKWVALTPEEWVRQQVIHYLHHQLGYPLEVMQVEGTIKVNNMSRRCDIVVYHDGKPHIIVECKKPEVPISQKVCDQACRYNSVLQVPYLLLTNGKQLAVIAIDYAAHALRSLPSLPCYGEKC